MSCHGCAKPFGFWTKELGCPGCGFSYCKRCIRYKRSDETKNNQPVCLRCSETRAISSSSPQEAITMGVSRLESLQNPARPPISIYPSDMQDSRYSLENLREGLSEEDQMIIDRLTKLKEETEELRRRNTCKETTDREIAKRLARLKGYDPDLLVTPADLKNNIATSSDLIEKFQSEVELDNKLEQQCVEDLEARLAKLKGVSESKSQNKDLKVQEELTDEEEVLRLMEQYKAEYELSEKLRAENAMEYKPLPMPDELNFDDDDDDVNDDDVNDDSKEYCYICSDTKAEFKCEECDDDVFCQSCWVEFHHEIGENHPQHRLK